MYMYMYSLRAGVYLLASVAVSNSFIVFYSAVILRQPKQLETVSVEATTLNVTWQPPSEIAAVYYQCIVYEVTWSSDVDSRVSVSASQRTVGRFLWEFW